MADRFTCDRCGDGLLAQHDVRYEVKIEVRSGYDPLELTHDDLSRDFDSEIRTLMEIASRMNPQELSDQVHKTFTFDLCARCQKQYLQDPLFRQHLQPHPRKGARVDQAPQAGCPEGT